MLKWLERYFERKQKEADRRVRFYEFLQKLDARGFVLEGDEVVCKMCGWPSCGQCGSSYLVNLLQEEYDTCIREPKVNA